MGAAGTGTDTLTEPGPGPAREQLATWEDLRPRIEQAARLAYDHEQAYRAELERRNDLMLMAFDHALAKPEAIAAAGGVTKTQVYRIAEKN